MFVLCQSNYCKKRHLLTSGRNFNVIVNPIIAIIIEVTNLTYLNLILVESCFYISWVSCAVTKCGSLLLNL